MIDRILRMRAMSSPAVVLATLLVTRAAWGLDGIAISNHFEHPPTRDWSSSYECGDIVRYTIVDDRVVSRVTLENTGRCRVPVLHPDGRQIAYHRNDNTVCVMDINGENARVLVSDVEFNRRTLDWPDGPWIYYIVGQEFWMVNAETGENRKYAGFSSGVNQLHLSRDGTRALVRAGGAWCIDFTDIDENGTINKSNGFWVDSCEGGHHSCGIGLSADGEWVMDGWVGHHGADLKRWGKCKKELTFFWTETDNWCIYPSECDLTVGAHLIVENWSCNSNWYVGSLTSKGGSSLCLINPITKQRVDVTRADRASGEQNDYTGDFWEGDPYTIIADEKQTIGVNPPGGTFIVDDAGARPQQVDIAVINNIPAQSIGGVEVRGAPSWLNVTVTGEGNDQTIVNSVDTARLPNDVTIHAAQCTVRVAEAANVAPYTIVCANGAFGEPISAPENPSPGLRYELWENQALSALPAFNSLGTPRQTGTSMGIDLSFPTPSDSFAVRFSGYIRIPETDVYTFYITTDDGSIVSIGDTEVINKDGQHFRPAIDSGTIALAAGYHPLNIGYFKNGGFDELLLYVKTPALRKHVVPSDWLFNAEAAPVAVTSHNVPRRYSVGDTMTVRFRSDSTVITEPYLMFSWNLGFSWEDIAGGSYSVFTPTGANEYEYRWLIPDTITLDDGSRVTTVAESCYVKVMQYADDDLSDINDAPISITGRDNALLRPAHSRDAVRMDRHGSVLRIYDNRKPVRIRVFGMDGALLAAEDAVMKSYGIPPELGRGIYQVMVNSREIPGGERRFTVIRY